MLLRLGAILKRLGRELRIYITERGKASYDRNFGLLYGLIGRLHSWVFLMGDRGTTLQDLCDLFGSKWNRPTIEANLKILEDEGLVSIYE